MPTPVDTVLRAGTRSHFPRVCPEGPVGPGFGFRKLMGTTVPTTGGQEPPSLLSMASSLVKWPCPLPRLTISALGDGQLLEVRGLAMPVVRGAAIVGLGTQQIPTKGAEENLKAQEHGWAAL